MFVVDTVLYLLVAWYVEAVFPGEYGIAQPWYFPVSRFSNGKLAVNNVSLNMYEGQITALLGHNGAGKTTTMSVLVGLFPASSGTALINGYDIRTEVDEVRASLGICPQHDVLFDELTVAEHIRFFCTLKGYDGDYREEIDNMLNILQLEDKRNAQSHTLSGGMKRKLSVGIALCGDSKVVLLDEPTSGMDPSARRSTWDLLQRERAGRTMLLTTHFMEEADLLGDRIAIMADGQLQCCGSSLFLKRKYGAGYHMVIVKEEGCDVEKITNTIQRFIPDIEYDQNIGAELSYVLPNEASAKFEEMFTELDERRAELKVSSYGASITTMEEVFIRVGEQSNPKVQEELRQRSEMANGGAGSRQTTPHGQDNVGFLPDVETLDVSGANGTHEMKPTLANFGSMRYMEEEEIEMVHRITIEKVPQERRNTSSFILFIQQFYAMLVKKTLYSIRNWVLTLVQIFLPIFFLSMALLVIMSFPGLADDPPMELKFTNYDGTNTPVWAEPGVPDAEELAAFVSTIDDTVIQVVNTTQFDNLTEYLLEKTLEDVPGFNQHYIAAVDLTSDGVSGLAVTAVFNNQPFHSAGVAMKAVDESLLRYYTNDSSLQFKVINHPAPISAQTKLQMQLNGQSNGFNIAFNVAFGVSFLAASFVLFLVKEMVTKAKHLQFVSGVGITVFWLSNLVWDYISYLIPACGMLLTLLAFQEEGFIEPETQGTLMLLFVLYGYAMLPQTYLFSFTFTVPSSGFTRVALFNIFTGMATMVTVSVMRIPLLELLDVADILDWIFMILPNYALGMGMADIYSNYQGQQYCGTIACREQLCVLLDKLNMTNPCCKELGNCGEAGCVYFNDNYLALERLGIGRTLLFMFAEGTVCLIILCLIELRVADKIKYFINNKRNTYGKLMKEADSSNENVIVAEVDSDVAAEKERIHTANIDTLKTNNVLVAKDLTKFYSKDFLAVDRLCLAVPKGECFGLLGINGAAPRAAWLPRRSAAPDRPRPSQLRRLRRPLWLAFRVLFTGVSLLLFVWHGVWSVNKYRYHRSLHSMQPRSYPAEGFELPGVTVCADRPYGQQVTLSSLMIECTISGRPCDNATLQWRTEEELTRVCFTGKPLTLGDRNSERNGYFFRLRFPESAAPGAMYDVYVHEAHDTRTSFFAFNGEKNVEVPLGELVKQELRLNERLVLSQPERPCRAEPGYSATDCLNVCFQEIVVAEAGADCGLDYFISGHPVCATPEQRYNVTAMAYRLGLRLFRESGCAPRCPPACLLRTYSLVPFSRLVRPWYLRQRVGVLTLNFDSPRYARSSEEVVYDFFSGLGDIGGAMGFLLGLSFLAVLDGIARLLGWLLPRLDVLLTCCERHSSNSSSRGSSSSSRSSGSNSNSSVWVVAS
ncbi:ATP-binding cassette sub-family A member 3 [Amphibalanus amphitrite]|uniref:ATP-binding cassette sub-family A member 3 n=1 Tax=Amphibalanus amphitrite TaxID=1232801 RepID=A0A6A4VUF9_AMPAM|nr:ATP-binding cassette sub-family A member 3 [Amphibalanus amphitrite]